LLEDSALGFRYRSTFMNPSRLAEMFEHALPLQPAERTAWLHRHCTDDPALRARLESLLRAHDHADSFLEAVPSDLIEGPPRLRGRDS
jgi:hypothetical protein